MYTHTLSAAAAAKQEDDVSHRRHHHPGASSFKGEKSPTIEWILDGLSLRVMRYGR